MEPNYYRILGVAEDAAASEIQQAYRRLAKANHPDVSGRDTLQTFLAVQRAWDVLGDRDRRRAYDRGLRPAGDAAPPSGQRQREPEHPAWSARPTPFPEAGWGGPAEELRLDLELESHEAAAGGAFPLDLPVVQSCPYCAGLSFRIGCPSCRGRGCVISRARAYVLVPAGVHTGLVMRLELEGEGLFHRRLVVRILIMN
jgi:molecular chaperone DnaJ